MPPGMVVESGPSPSGLGKLPQTPNDPEEPMSPSQIAADDDYDDESPVAARNKGSVASMPIVDEDITGGETRPLGRPIMMAGRGSILKVPDKGDAEQSKDDENSKKPSRSDSKKSFGNSQSQQLIKKLASDQERLQAKRNLAYQRMSPFRRKMVRFVGHKGFQLGISGVIVANAIYIGIETDLSCPEGDTECQASEPNWYIPEAVFTTIFTLELLCRIFTEQGLFFLDSWNNFDFVLVTLAFLDTYILKYIPATEMPGGGVFVALRVLRLLRLARIVRLLRFFKELWLLVVGVVDAMRTLVWAWILMALIVYIFAILAVRTIGQPYKDQDEDMDTFFGNVPTAMFCLFTVMTTEGWAAVARASMRHEPVSAFFFIFFLGCTTFAVMNVVVAVIVENTLDQAVHQKDDLQSRAQEEQRSAATKILEIFYAADQDNNGNLTKTEFLEALERPDVVKYLHEVGIDVRQAENLFDILDFDDSGELDASEFLQGVLKARGEAKAKDILAVQCDIWRAERQMLREAERLQRSTMHEVREVTQRMDKLMQGIADLEHTTAGTGTRAGASLPAAPLLGANMPTSLA